MKILLTGAAGFIGSNLCRLLLDEGHEVTALDNFDDFYNPEIKRNNISGFISQKNFRLIEGDIRNSKDLEIAFSVEPEIVVHLAARAGVRPSIQHPELYYDVNVTGTLRLLESMKKSGCKKMVFASSSSVYGNNKKVPFSETDNVDFPISPYAATKKAGELLCHTFHHLYGFDIFCLRFFTVFGPGQRPEMAIHYFTRNILEGKPIKVFGDGSTRRDYTFVEDIVAGIEGSMKNLKGFEIINLGESATITLKDLISLIEKETGKKAIIHRETNQAGDVEITYADIQKARNLIEYNPSTPVELGIRKFAAWYQKTRSEINI